MRRARRLLAWALTAVAALSAPASAAPAVAPKPQRIMSMNLCTDLLLLQLVPKDRIAAITYLAHDAAQDFMPGRDAGVAINHGTAEDIIRLRPDLILAGDFSTATTRRLAQRVGAPIVAVERASDFDDIRRIIRKTGAAVGEPARAEALVRRMDAALAEAAARRPDRPIRVVAWEGGDSVPGRGTLANAIIEAAGAVNVAAGPGAAYTTFDAERLLMADPEALLSGGGGAGKPLLRDEQGRHRAIRQRFAGRRIAFPEPAYACGLPQSGEAARDLQRALEALPPKAPLR